MGKSEKGKNNISGEMRDCAENDIMSIRRPPSKYPKMSIEDRAKQFGAFDPLTGLAEALSKKEKEFDNK